MVLKKPQRRHERAERPGLVTFVLVPVLYWIGAAIGTRLTLTPDGLSLLWLPNAVLVAAFVRFRGRGWLIFALSALVAEIVADLPFFSVSEALVFGLSNVVEATVAWRCLTRWQFDPRFPDVSDVGKFLVAGPVAGAATGALVGTAALHALASTPTPLDTALLWWLGDALGQLILTPVYLSLWFPPPEAGLPRMVRPRRTADTAMLVGGVLVLATLAIADTGMVFGMHVRPVLLLPFVLYSAARLPLRGACLVVLALSLALVALTTSGHSPFGIRDPAVAAIWVQEFVLVMSVLSLGLRALLTNIRLGEAQLLRANQDLRAKSAALELSNTELRRIAFATAHDLQTPLRSISGFSQLLDAEYGDKLGPVGEGWVRRVTDNTAQLVALLQDLGTLATIDSSTGPIEVVDMDRLLGAVLGGFEGPIREAGALVTSDRLPRVRGEREQLGRLLGELICNAIRFRGRAPPRIHVSVRAAEETLQEFSVSDNGIGIAAEHHARVFDLFYRPPEAREAPGTGFGLAMCACVVHRHGGRIRLTSVPGEGTTVYFTLPRAEAG